MNRKAAGGGLRRGPYGGRSGVGSIRDEPVGTDEAKAMSLDPVAPPLEQCLIPMIEWGHRPRYAARDPISVASAAGSSVRGDHERRESSRNLRMAEARARAGRSRSRRGAFALTASREAALGSPQQHSESGDKNRIGDRPDPSRPKASWPRRYLPGLRARYAEGSCLRHANRRGSSTTSQIRWGLLGSTQRLTLLRRESSAAIGRPARSTWVARVRRRPVTLPIDTAGIDAPVSVGKFRGCRRSNESDR